MVTSQSIELFLFIMGIEMLAIKNEIQHEHQGVRNPGDKNKSVNV